MRRVAVFVLTFAFLAAGCHRAEKRPVASEAPTPASSVAVPAAAASVKTGPLSFAPVAKKADPSVVTIYARARTGKGLGTGFVADTSGVIVTNNHVVDGAQEIVVKLSDDRRVPGKVAGRDPRTDIAVVKIDDVEGLTPLPFGDSDRLEVGDWVVAIGNPFGLSHTVSAGIVSGKGRGREDVPLDESGYYDFIQTDASINPGNSGGPLLDLEGNVVGMNTAIRGGAHGIGFAIPINMVKKLVPALAREGHLTRSALGIRIGDARATDGRKGVVVHDVDPDGPAGKAKVLRGDLVVAFDGQPVERGSALQWLASTAGVGKTVPIRVVREGKTLDFQVTLGRLEDPRQRVRIGRNDGPIPGQGPDDDDP